MDTFIDKLAQKRNAQEMIRANMSAEAERMEQMQNQMQAYDALMQEIRQVNLKTAENAAQVQDALKECIARLEALQEEEKKIREAQAEEERLKAKQAEEEQSDEKELMLAQIKELLEEKFRQSDDFLHRENVKVYRNVQAAVIEELNRQTEELKNSHVKNRGSRAVLPISILILLGVAANIVIQLLSITIPIK